MTSANGSRLSRMMVAVLAGVCLVAVGAVASWAILVDDPPSLLVKTAVAGSAPVVQREFDDSQLVSVAVTQGSAQALVAPAGGVVTAFTCGVGQPVSSGQSVMSIGPIPIISLATGVPLWRDIKSGDRGGDVTALAAELTRLGRFDGDVEGSAGRGLLAAVRQLQKDLGTPEADLVDQVIPMSQLAWLPTDQAVAASCDVSVGSTVTPGTTVIGFDAPIVAATVSADTTRFAPGDRTLIVDGHRLAVGPDGAITDPDALTQLSASPSVTNARRAGVLNSLHAHYPLATPMTVSVIPPVSIRPIAKGRGCVVAADQALPVTIVASELGQSFVTFDGPAPQSVRLDPPSDLTCS